MAYQGVPGPSSARLPGYVSPHGQLVTPIGTSVTIGKIKKPRRWGQSCVECRRRKKGCAGRDEQGNSLCTYCPAFGLACVFQKQAEPDRVKDLEKRVTRMQDFIRGLADASPEEQQMKLNAWLQDPQAVEAVRCVKKRRRTDAEDPTPSPTPTSTFSNFPSSPLTMPLTLPPRSDAEAASRMRALLDAAGFDLARGALARPQTASSGQGHGTDDGRPIGGSQVPAVSYDEHWPAESVPQLEKIGFEAAREMLDLYFAWWNPRWNIIEQSLFEESMRNGDNLFCTPFLLMSLFSLVAPHSFHSSSRTGEFGARAHYLLGVELYAAKPRITTVQGLLCLAAFASDKTRHAQSYNFVGFAMRMLEDLSFAASNELSDSETQVRNRCAWFCYGADKMVSLTMSRPPRHPTRSLPPLPEIDPILDEHPWMPVRHHHRSTLAHPSPPEMSQPGLQSTCHRHWCEAQLFFDEVLHQIYAIGHENAAESRTFVLSMRERFEDWQAMLPHRILITLDNMPAHCPPAHVIYLNLVIRVIGLLLYKPFMLRPDVDIPDVELHCAHLAEETHMLFRLYDTAFPPALSTLNVLHVFAALSAAHIDIVRLRDERTPPQDRHLLVERLGFTARLLAEGAGLRTNVGPTVAKLQAQRDAALKEHRGRYDPIRDHYDTQGSADDALATPDPAVLHAQHQEEIDFSSLSQGLFDHPQVVPWTAFRQEEDITRVLTELQQFATVNNAVYG